MANPDRSPETLRRRYLHNVDNPTDSPTAFIASALASGYSVSGEVGLRMGRTRGLVNIVVGDMKIAGWRFEKRALDGGPLAYDKAPALHLATHRPDGSVIARVGGPVPASPWDRDPDEERKRVERERKREERKRKQAAKHEQPEHRGEVVHVGFGGNGKGRATGREALLRPAPVVPAVGTLLRASMVAEDNGSAVLALHDETGAIWFARLEHAPSHE